MPKVGKPSLANSFYLEPPRVISRDPLEEHALRAGELKLEESKDIVARQP